MFGLVFTESARGDLDWFKHSEQSLILDHMEKQLLWEPAKETKREKH